MKSRIVVTALSLVLGSVVVSGIQILLLGVGGPRVSAADGVPAGAVLLITSGTCPATYSEVSSLSTKFPLGTVAASSNIGTTGGVDSVTPAGTNSAPTFTGSAWSAPAISWPAGVPTHSGTAISDHASHTHTYTDVVNHVHVENINSGTTGGSNGFGVDTSTNGSSATGYSTANPTGGVATGTTAGPSATLTHTVSNQGTIAWPAGVPTIAAYTPAGTNSAPTFTGSSQENRPAFVRVIFCSKD